MFGTMTSTRRASALAAAAAGALGLAATGLGAADDAFVTVDRFVPHTSTVPANEGERVGLFLHEKLSRDLADRIAAGERPEGRVVLFVHGGSIPSVPDYDLPYKDYSWMEHLAAAGVRHVLDGPDRLRAVAAPDDGRSVQHGARRPGRRQSQPAGRGLRAELPARADHEPVRLGRDRAGSSTTSASCGASTGSVWSGGPRAARARAASRRAIPRRSTSWCCSPPATGVIGPPLRRKRSRPGRCRCACRLATRWRERTLALHRRLRGSDRSGHSAGHSGRPSWPTTSGARSGDRRTA